MVNPKVQTTAGDKLRVEKMFSEGGNKQYYYAEVEVTPGMALYILEHHNNTNRPIDQSQVNKLIPKMHDGTYDGRAGNLTFSEVKECTNGQHGMSAQVATNTTVLYSVKTNCPLDHASKVDVGKARTSQDIFTAIKKRRGEEPTYVNKKTADAQRVLIGFGSSKRSKHTPNSVAEYAASPDFEVYLEEIIKAVAGGNFDSSPVRSALMNLYLREPSEDRWNEVMSVAHMLNRDSHTLGGAKNKDHAMTKFMRWYSEVKLKTKVERNFSVSGREYYAMALSAFECCVTTEAGEKPKVRGRLIPANYDPLTQTNFGIVKR